MISFAVVFDMDGLMLDTERVARDAWIRALADHGLTLNHSAYLRLIGRSARNQDTQAILEEVIGAPLLYGDLVKRKQVYYDAEIEANGILIKPGLLELLTFLEGRNIPKAVASSTVTRLVAQRLGRVGIAARFHVLVGGDQVPNAKPAPDLFIEAARRLEVSPGRCVALEDSEAGIRAAHEAGMLPVMVPDLKQPEPQIAALTYCVVPSLNRVIPLLERFLETGLPVK